MEKITKKGQTMNDKKIVKITYRFDDPKNKDKFLAIMKYANKQITCNWIDIFKVEVTLPEMFERTVKSMVEEVGAIFIIDTEHLFKK